MATYCDICGVLVPPAGRFQALCRVVRDPTPTGNPATVSEKAEYADTCSQECAGKFWEGAAPIDAPAALGEQTTPAPERMKAEGRLTVRPDEKAGF